MSFAGPPPIRIDPTHIRFVKQWQHPAALIGCRIDPSDRFVFAGAQDNVVVRWELATGKKTVLAGHKSWIRALAFADKGKLTISADWAGRIIAWPTDADTPTPRWNIVGPRGWVRALAVSPDGKTLASCGNDHLVKIWSLPDGKPLKSLRGHDSHVYNVAYHPDGRSLVSADLMGIVKVWDLARGEVSREMDAKILHKYDSGFGADIGGVRSMAFDADGKHLACAGITNVSNAFAGVGNPLLVVFDWATGKQKVQLKPKVGFNGTAWGVLFHPGGWVLGVGGGNGGVFWSWKLDQPLAGHTFALPNNARDLAMTSDGRRLVVPFDNGMLRVYDMGR